jgi:acetyl-CoA carboxylase biotin carboxylase subunit
VANRGEIAVRIIRSCREMGIETVAVYSTADRDGLAVRMADRAVCIGPAASAESYLHGDSLLTAALFTGCSAVHPGVGFLSESAAFARAAVEHGLLWIGPRPETIALLGDKVSARRIAAEQGLPITPGTEEAVADIDGALKAALTIGFPLIIKAAAGGGGRGMRIVVREEELAESLDMAQREAEAFFGDGRVLMERYIEHPRHVEIQALGDGRGGVLVLGERDCTVQRRHQKLIEESPSPFLSPSIRSRMTKGAAALFSALNYRGAGTIEFLLDCGGGDENPAFYFMEVNTRLQVEHPVTEMLWGVDLVRQQILSCTEGRLDPLPAGGAFAGSAIECRINALGPGKVEALEVPGGPDVRFDSFLYPGCTVPPHYDPLLGKLIVRAPSREQAISRMERALGELSIQGIPTNQEDQLAIIRDKIFRAGRFDTHQWAASAL